MFNGCVYVHVEQSLHLCLTLMSTLMSDKVCIYVRRLRLCLCQSEFAFMFDGYVCACVEQKHKPTTTTNFN